MEMPDKIYAERNIHRYYDAFDEQPSHVKLDTYHHSRIVEALRKENEELKAKLDKVKWQPISSAPLDGTDIMGYPEYKKMSWDNVYTWSDEDCNVFEPTHWMPLPDAPEKL